MVCIDNPIQSNPIQSIDRRRGGGARAPHPRDGGVSRSVLIVDAHISINAKSSCDSLSDALTARSARASDIFRATVSIVARATASTFTRASHASVAVDGSAVVVVVGGVGAASIATTGSGIVDGDDPSLSCRRGRGVRRRRRLDPGDALAVSLHRGRFLRGHDEHVVRDAEALSLARAHERRLAALHGAVLREHRPALEELLRDRARVVVVFLALGGRGGVDHVSAWMDEGSRAAAEWTSDGFAKRRKRRRRRASVKGPAVRGRLWPSPRPAIVSRAVVHAVRRVSRLLPECVHLRLDLPEREANLPGVVRRDAAASPERKRLERLAAAAAAAGRVREVDLRRRLRPRDAIRVRISGLRAVRGGVRGRRGAHVVRGRHSTRARVPVDVAAATRGAFAEHAAAAQDDTRGEDDRRAQEDRLHREVAAIQKVLLLALRGRGVFGGRFVFRLRRRRRAGQRGDAAVVERRKVEQSERVVPEHREVLLEPGRVVRRRERDAAAAVLGDREPGDVADHAHEFRVGEVAVGAGGGAVERDPGDTRGIRRVRSLQRARKLPAREREDFRDAIEERDRVFRG
eukprot:31117-Pelagococcus_subviridis.AAC.29